MTVTLTRCSSGEPAQLIVSPKRKMKDYKFTEYFEKEVLRKRPYLKKEWCIQIVNNPLRAEPQEQNRFHYWGIVDELGGKVLRVVTLSDKITIHNAFPDRGYKP